MIEVEIVRIRDVICAKNRGKKLPFELHILYFYINMILILNIFFVYKFIGCSCNL